METVVEGELGFFLLLRSQCLTFPFLLGIDIVVAVAEEEVGSQILGIGAHDGLCCRGREGIVATGLTVSTEDGLNIAVDIVGEAVPRELGLQCALLQDTNLVGNGLTDDLTAGSTTLAHEKGINLLELNTGNNLNTHAVDELRIIVSRTHDNLLAYLLCYVLDLIGRECVGLLCACVCHNFIILMVRILCLCCCEKVIRAACEGWRNTRHGSSCSPEVS